MTNVTFSLISPSGKPICSKVTISPYATPASYNGSVITNDSVIIKEHTGNFSCSLWPSTYKVDLYGYNARSEFLLSIPTSSDFTTVNAANCLTNLPPGPYSIADYANFSGTASYALTSANNSTSSFQIYNAQTGLYYNLAVTGAAGFEQISLIPISN